MKKMVMVEEKDGLETLLGQVVEIWCLNYIYSGELIGVNDTQVMLKDARVVYETGPTNTKTQKNTEVLRTGTWYIRVSAIESFGVLG